MEEEGYSQMMLLGKKDYSGDDMKENEKYFGTIALRINSDMDPQELFEIYKERELIEDGNKAHKNVLDNLASHKRHTPEYDGWLFLNHISLMLYYRVRNRIKEKGPDSKYSVEGCGQENHNAGHRRQLGRERPCPSGQESLYRNSSIGIPNVKRYGLTVNIKPRSEIGRGIFLPLHHRRQKKVCFLFCIFISSSVT